VVERGVRRLLAVHFDKLPGLALRDPEAHVARCGHAGQHEADVHTNVGTGVDAAAITAQTAGDELKRLPGDGRSGLVRLSVISS
jgi:hypothetical protein